MGEDIRKIRAMIEEAFAGVPRDEDCTLHQAQLADQSMNEEVTEEEWLAEKARDPETDWQQVPAQALDECDAALSHASPQSWLFYLPAYMRRALELLDSDEWLPGAVIFHLTYGEGLRHYALERFTLLNHAQENAVIEFLEYVHDYPSKDPWNSKSATEALNSYWAVPADKRPTNRILLVE